MSSGFGVVIIGRNEGQRLLRCLQSVMPSGSPIVYVDSGSTDASTAAARSLGVDVFELDQSLPFSAARARNEGLKRLVEMHPQLKFVQFVDGDCEIAPGWLQRAAEELERNPKIGIVCGRLRERFPEASVFNRLCDLEWNSGFGEIKACGGVCMARIGPFVEVGCFNPTIVAGEEAELCLRLRQQ